MPAKKVIKSFNNHYNLTFKLNNNEIVLFLNIFKATFLLRNKTVGTALLYAGAKYF